MVPDAEPIESMEQPIEEDVPDIDEIETGEIMMTRDIALKSYNALVNMALVHCILLPLGMISKVRSGWASDTDRLFWLVSTSW